MKEIEGYADGLQRLLAQADRHNGQLKVALEDSTKRIKELEKCLFEGLTVTSTEELSAWFKRANALLGTSEVGRKEL